MSMISAIDVGERSRDRGGIVSFREGQSPLAAYTALRGQRTAMAGHNVLNPGAIRQAAAQAVNEEKKLELEERKVAVLEAAEQRTAVEQAERRRMDEQQKRFEREQAIDTEYETKMKGIQERYTKDTEEGRKAEQYERGKDIQARKDAFPKLMEGVYGRNPQLVKDYINNFGDKRANVSDVQFSSPEVDPKNPNAMIITYEDGGKSFFKDPKDFYQNFAALIDPKIEEAIYTRRLKESEEERKTAKAGREQAEFEGRAPLTPKELADLRVKGEAAYKNDPEVYDKVSGDKKPGAPSKEEYVKKYIEEVTGKAQEAKGKGTGGEYTELRAPDGRVKREYADGRVEILRDGEVIAAKDKNGNVIKVGPKKAKVGSEIDYGTGKATEEGEAALEAQAKKEKGTAEEAERKSAIKGKEPTPTGTAQYTDKATGHQMKVTVYSDGTTKTERIESKKKKRKKGNGEGDNGE